MPLPVRTRLAAFGALLLAGLLTTPLAAQFQIPGQGDQPMTAETLARLEVLTDTAEVQPGETFHLVFLFEIRPTWHIYWKNPGEGAAAPDITVEAPEGWEVGEMHWPRPQTFESVVGDMYGYSRSAALFVPITPPSTLDESSITLSYRANWAVCDDARCLMGNERKEISLPIGRDGSIAAPDSPAALRPHLDRLPVLLEAAGESAGDGEGAEPQSPRTARAELDEGDLIEAVLEEDELIITGPASGHDTITFYPHWSRGVELGEGRATIEGDRFRVVVPVRYEPANLERHPHVGGLVALGVKGDDPAYEVSFRVDRARIRRDS